MDGGGGCSQNSKKLKVQNLELEVFLELNGHGLIVVEVGAKTKTALNPIVT